jgi:hypothetical protein
MPCLFVLLALAAPRLVVLVLWFATTWFRGIFATILWPVLGFVFLPTTLLWYTAVQNWFGGHWTLWPVVGLVVALGIDVSPATRAPRRQKSS